MAPPLIEFRNVTKRFGARVILDNVDLSIYEGQTTTIIGKSGVGKSVTLKHIIGLLEPDEGEILFRGKSLRAMKRKERAAMRDELSYMFQNCALFDSMTVFDNVALPLREGRKMKKDEIARRVMSKIDELELSEVAYAYPSQISGGMQKRVALARALVTEPKIVLFDEPTSGLDPIRKNAVLGMIAHYRNQFGFTAVVVSHDIPDVFFISNRIAIVYDSKIIFQGSPLELEQFDHPVIEEFIESLRALNDELPGSATSRSFDRHCQHLFGIGKSEDDFTVVLLSLNNLETVETREGREKTQEVVKSLAALIDKHLGGLSTRYCHNEFLSVLPQTDLNQAQRLLRELAADMQAKEILLSQGKAASQDDLWVSAGVAQGAPGTQIDALAAQARSSQAAFLGNTNS